MLASFQLMGTLHDLAALVEGESVSNNGTAIVLSHILLGVVPARSFDTVTGLLDFSLASAMGCWSAC